MRELISQLFNLCQALLTAAPGDLQMPEQLNEVLWQIQVGLWLAPQERLNYQNAVRRFSDRQYLLRKGYLTPIWRNVLQHLEVLLEDCPVLSQFQSAQVKGELVGLTKRISTELSRLGISPTLSASVDRSLEEIRRRGEFSSGLIRLLIALEKWLDTRDNLSDTDLVDQLLVINFNHPVLLGYLIQQFPRAENKQTDSLLSWEDNLMEKCQYLDFLVPDQQSMLDPNQPSLISQYRAFLHAELEWVGRRLQQIRTAVGAHAPVALPPINESVKLAVTKFRAKWPAEKSDLIELTYALYVYMRVRGSKITLVELSGWLEDAFGVSLARFSHRFAEIKMRKSTRPSKFLDSLVEEFLNYVEEGDAFLPEGK